MSGVEILLDTNAVIAWNRVERELLEKLVAYGSPGMSLFTLGELEFGASNSTRIAENKNRIARTLRDMELILPDETTAANYGAIRAALRKKGRHIPENDVWIAAVAMQHKLPLVTRDAHFDEVEGLETIEW